MIPDTTQSPADLPPVKSPDDAALAGYEECATEALRWLSGLGCEPGHPLMRSLAAHLTKKPAYLEKINLERFIVRRAMREGSDENKEGAGCPTYQERLAEVRQDVNIQKALIETAFKGCDLQYFRSSNP